VDCSVRHFVVVKEVTFDVSSKDKHIAAGYVNDEKVDDDVDEKTEAAVREVRLACFCVSKELSRTPSHRGGVSVGCGFTVRCFVCACTRCAGTSERASERARMMYSISPADSRSTGFKHIR